MRQDSILLRPAKPTFEEGLVFAGYLDQAAEGFFRFMLGRDVAHIVATVYLKPDHDLSFQNVTFAERGGVIAGMVSGFTAEQHRRSPQGLLKRAAGRGNLRMRAVATLCAPLLRIIDTLDEGDFYLQAIAVDEELRGKGVGSTLLDSVEARAVAGKSARLVLDVSAKNDGARRLYERRGMAAESKWPKVGFIPPLLVRMTREI